MVSIWDIQKETPVFHGINISYKTTQINEAEK